MPTRPECAWSPAPSGVLLPADEVHVWRANLNLRPECLSALRSLLPEEERMRADRFLRERDRTRFAAGRGHLRVILARYLSLAPGEVLFRYGKRGKPALDPALTRDSPADLLRFNASHSGDLLLVGLTLGRDIGIDVEAVRPVRDAEAIVERFFSEQESREFRSVPDPLKLEAFYTCWTRKEAYLKATGEGLSLPLNRFSVSVLPGEPVQLRSDVLTPAAVALWTLREIRPASGYVGAVAVGGPPPWVLRCWQAAGA